MMRIDNTTLRDRVKKIEEVLKQQSLEALVIYANGSALGSTSRMHGYMRYLTNFDGHNTTAMLVLRPGHEPTLVSGTNPFNLRVLLKDLLWFKDVRTAKPAALGNEIVAIFDNDSRRRRRIGYIGLSETPVPVWTAIERGLPNVE